MDNQTKIANALAALVNSQDDDGFVIIEHKDTSKFVQFAGSKTEPLVLDLPSQPLSEEEFYRAVELFRSMGVKGEEYDVFDEPGGKVVGQQFTFNKAFHSIDEATAAAIDVLTTVYRFPADCDLRIIEE